MTKRLEIAIETSSASSASRNGSRPVIRGSALRGALAGRILAVAEHRCTAISDSCDFCSIFLSEKAARFGDLYPSWQGRNSLPAPLTMVSCICDDEHGPFDILGSRIVQAVSGRFEDFCCSCGGSTEIVSRDLLVGEDGVAHASGVYLSWKQRVSIDRSAGSASGVHHKPIIAGSDGSGSGLRFSGHVVCDESCADLLMRLLPAVQQIGSGASCGDGRVSVTASDAAETGSASTRVAAFNRMILQKLDALEVCDLEQEYDWSGYFPDREQLIAGLRSETEGFFVVTLLSEAILSELFSCDSGMVATGRQSLQLSVDLLRSSAGCNLDCRLVFALSRPVCSGGWNSAWGLPKPETTATSAGSVFLYHTRALPDWMELFQSIESNGVGDRVQEGFGEVMICAPVHIGKEG